MSWHLRECIAACIFSGVVFAWITAEMWHTVGALVCFWAR